MKKLYLLRHAHSEPKGPGLTDYDRPLDVQGRAEAEAVAAYLTETRLDFDFVMCSAAVRCQETLEPIRRLIKTGLTQISNNYYNISEEEILTHLREAPDESSSLLYIGHNPGLSFAVLRLARILPDFLMEGLKPATFVGFQIPIQNWSELNWKQGDIIDMYHPNIDSTGSPEPVK